MTLPGGPAEKHGHHYEDLWTIWQFVRMLHGRAEAIRIEDPGFPKTEFWLEARGRRELHQVKRQHPNGKWSLHALERESLIRAMHDHLRGNNDRFVFASGSDAPELRSLCEAARDADSETEFKTRFLESKGRRGHFEQLCTWWACDVPTAIDLLRRIQVHSIDQRELDDKVRSALPALFLAEADTVVAALRRIVDDSVHGKWTRRGLTERLTRQGYPLRRVVSPTNAAPAIESVTDAYLQGTRSRLIHGRMLPRPATTAILSAIQDDLSGDGNGTDSVVLGAAGAGKTASVAAFIDELRALGLPTLAFRLDRVPASAWSTGDLGRYLGLDESPALVLSAAAESTGRPSVLVVDQLDAVSTMSGRNPEALDLVGQLLHEARSTRLRTAIHTVVVCRAFDWNNDWRLRRLTPNGSERGNISEFTITEFTTEDVAEVLAAADFDPTQFRSSQLELLQLPQNLSVFLEANFDPAETPAFDTVTRLFGRYWNEARRRVKNRNPSNRDEWTRVISTLCNDITDTQQLSVAREKLDDFQPEYLNCMVSEEVLSFDGRRYGFGHESFFDYCFARRFCTGWQSLVSFLTDSGQDLFRRAQVRQVLAYLRDSDADRYVREIRELLSHERIRPHIKDLVFALLADVPSPTEAEWEIWEAQMRRATEAIAEGTSNRDQLSAIAWRRLFASPTWFAFLDEQGIVRQWLESGNHRLVDLAIDYLQNHQRHSPNRVVAAIEPYADTGGDWIPRLRRIVVRATYGGSRPFVDLFLRLLDNGTLDEDLEPTPHDHVFRSVLHDLVKSGHVEWIPEVLAHRLRRRIAVIRAAGRRVERGTLFGYKEQAIKALRVAADKVPAILVEHLLPIVLDISDHDVVGEETPTADTMWPRYTMRDPAGSREGALLSNLARALAKLAEAGDPILDDVIAQLHRRHTHTANHLLLALFRGGGPRYADEAVDALVGQPWRLECGYVDNPRWCAMETIRFIAPHCTEAKRWNLESLLLTYRSPFERTSAGLRCQGRSRFDLLSAIPKGLRSDIASRHFRELERKFGNPTDEPQVLGAASIVGSPIPPQATERMTDDQWLDAIKKYRSEFPTHSADAFFKGGAVELSRELGARTKDDPERFARLALRFPEDAHPSYLDEILRGLKKVPMSSALKTRVCGKAFDLSREYCGGTIADVIGHIEGRLPERAIEMLSWLATEDDSAPGLKSEDLYAQGINMTRGRAAQALHGLFLTDATYIDRFRSVIERLVRDPSPAVLSCVAGTIAAIWRHDAQVGMHLFEALDLAEDRLLTTPHVHALLHHVVRTNRDVGRPLVVRMLQSRDADVNEAGGRLAGLAALYHAGAGELAEEALGGGIPHRLGIAQVAATNLELSQCREWCEQTLVVLFNDNDATVRMRAAGCFGATGDIPLDQYSDVISQFCESRAFRDHADSLLRALEESPHRLPGLTCDVCQRVLEILSQESGRAYQYRISAVATLVFRTYQHHQHDEWTTQALDLIDRLCLAGDGSASRHIEEFER